MCLLGNSLRWPSLKKAETIKLKKGSQLSHNGHFSKLAMLSWWLKFFRHFRTRWTTLCQCCPSQGELTNYLYLVLWCGTDSIRYVTLHFRDRRYTASLRYRNRAEITVLVCEQKPYPVLFSCRFKSCLGEWEKSLSWLFPVSYWINHYPGYQRFFSRAAGIFGVGRSREKKRETALEKVSGTQGDRSLASERYIVMSTKCLATNFLDQ